MKINKFISKLVFAILLVFAFSITTNAATLSISSNSTSVNVGSTVSLSVVVNSEGVAINNAEAVVKFPNDIFEVVSVSKGSVFNLWVEEPTYSNTDGTVSFNGGLPTPGFTGPYGNVLNITLRAKKAGSGEITISDSAVRANDGLGTDVLTGQSGKVISVVDAPVEVKVTPKVVPTETVSSESVSAPAVSSPTHLNQDVWYKDNNPIIQWDIPSNASSVQAGLSLDQSELPKTTFSSSVTHKTFADTADGIWYFKVRYKAGGVWSDYGIYTLKIDTTAPLKKNVDFSLDEKSNILHISSEITDSLSGLDHYEVIVNGSLFKTIPVSEFVGGKYDLLLNITGKINLKLVAYDKAGNTVDAEGQIINNVVTKNIPKTNIPLMAFVYGIATLLIFALGYYSRIHLVRYVHRLRIRRAMANGDSAKVLSLIKTRLEKHLELLHNIRHHRVLTKEEKKIKEELEDDLDEIDKGLE